MSTLIPIDSTGSCSQDNKARKGSKRHPNRRVRNKLLLFADDMTVYVQNLKEATKTLIRTIVSEFSRVTGYKINI